MDPTLPKGSQRLKFWIGFGDGTRYFDLDEQDIPILIEGQVYDLETRDFTFDYQYGWTDDMVVVFNSVHESRTLKTATGEFKTSGISGYYTALRQRVGGRGTSTQILAETGVLFSEDQNPVLPLASGEVDWFAIMSYNQDFFPMAGGFEMDFGYRFRGGAPDDEIFFNTSLSLGLFKGARAKLLYAVTESKSDEKVNYDLLEYPAERGSQALGLEISRKLGRRWEVAVSYNDRFKGRNQYQREGFKLSLTWWR